MCQHSENTQTHLECGSVCLLLQTLLLAPARAARTRCLLSRHDCVTLNGYFVFPAQKLSSSTCGVCERVAGEQVSVFCGACQRLSQSARRKGEEEAVGTRPILETSEAQVVAQDVFELRCFFVASSSSNSSSGHNPVFTFVHLLQLTRQQQQLKWQLVAASVCIQPGHGELYGCNSPACISEDGTFPFRTVDLYLARTNQVYEWVTASPASRSAPPSAGLTQGASTETNRVGYFCKVLVFPPAGAARSRRHGATVFCAICLFVGQSDAQSSLLCSEIPPVLQYIGQQGVIAKDFIWIDSHQTLCQSEEERMKKMCHAPVEIITPERKKNDTPLGTDTFTE